jgi:V/A-type H+-transporting ATPase subunit I
MRVGRIRLLRTVQKAWAFVTAAGGAAIVFGLLYGEAFGPTGLVPVLWLAPLTSPIPLLLTALLVGAALLAGAYALGTVNRIREGGWGQALYSRTGLAGSLLFVAVGLLAWGLVAGYLLLLAAAVVVALVALALIFIGLFAASGGGAEGAVEASVEMVDAIVRLGSNLVSFARLAAFGLTHAALGAVVWDGTIALWQLDWRAAAAVALFVVGNAVSFALEALVAGVQALRLEYYELFSRIFESEGRPFLAWTPVLTGLEATEPLPAGPPPGAGTSSERKVE